MSSGVMEDIKVSIICNAYNHEPYIRDALEGFVMQRTSFAFEVLIHDDASTDKTADIIREYEAKYPEIIKPIYQTENQYTKGGVSRFQEPRIKGKYVAFCEGDDYWTDPYKLQKQYDAMEAHPEVDICAHAAVMVDAKDGKELKRITPSDVNCVFSVEEVILGGGGFVASASLFFRSEFYSALYEFRRFFRLDFTLQIQGSLRGGMLYLNDNMSVYRYMSVSSWSLDMQRNKEKRIAHNNKIQRMLEILNEETGFKYDSTIKTKILKNELTSHLANGDFKSAVSPRYKSVISELSAKERLKIRIKAYFPFLVTLKNKLRK